MEQRAVDCCVRVLLVCEYRLWQRVAVALPALSPGVIACRRILNRRQCAKDLLSQRVAELDLLLTRMGPRHLALGNSDW